MSVVFLLLAVGVFLSTLSLRRATFDTVQIVIIVMDFYPRSPCGERRVAAVVVIIIPTISIHALLAESDAP